MSISYAVFCLKKKNLSILPSLQLVVEVLVHVSCHHPAPPDVYTLSLHDALPISPGGKPCIIAAFAQLAVASRHSHAASGAGPAGAGPGSGSCTGTVADGMNMRSEEHTSELQSHVNLVCRLLLEKKKSINTAIITARSRGSRPCFMSSPRAPRCLHSFPTRRSSDLSWRQALHYRSVRPARCRVPPFSCGFGCRSRGRGPRERILHRHGGRRNEHEIGRAHV